MGEQVAEARCSLGHTKTVQGLLDYLGIFRLHQRSTEAMKKLTEYLHTAAAADFLGVAQNTLRKWAARDEIPMHRNPVNGYRLFERGDLERFLLRIEQPVSAAKKPVEICFDFSTFK